MSAPTKVARQGLYNFLAIASTSAAGILSTALIAHHLTPDRMGYYTLVVWISAMVGMLANLGYVTTTMKAMAEALGRKDLRESAGVLAFSHHRVLRMGLLTTLAMAIAAPLLARACHHPELAVALLVGSLGILPAALYALYTAACQALEAYGHVAWITALTSSAMMGGIWLVLARHGSLAALLAVTGLAMALGAGVAFLVLSRWLQGWWRVELAPDKRIELRNFQWPVFVMLVLDSIVWQRSEVFFLGAYAPAHDVAFYGMAYSLSSMAMKLVPGTLIGLLIPKMSRAVGSGDGEGLGELFEKSCRYMAMLALPVAVGGALLARPIVHLLYGSAYDPVAGLMGALLVANALVMIYGFPTSSILYSANGQKQLVRIGLVVSALNLLLAWILIPRFGAWGAVGANSLAQLSSLVPGLIVAKRRTGAQAPVRLVLQVLVAAVLMGIPVWGIVHLGSPVLALALGPLVGLVAFGALIYALGLIGVEDRLVLQAIARRFPTFQRRG